MSYNAIDLTNYNFEDKFVNFINTYQDIYINKVLQNAPAPLEVQKLLQTKEILKQYLKISFFLQNTIMFWMP